METSNENLISLLVAKELEIKQMQLYIQQLETSYNDLAVKYNALVHKHYTKEKRRQIVYKLKSEEQ